MSAVVGPRADGVAVVYHFFAHYRAAVMRALQADPTFHYLFVGDVTDPQDTGIRAWADVPPDRFVRTHCRMLPGGILWQSGLLRLALRRDLRAVVFLGDVHYATTWIAAVVARLSGKRVLFWTIGWHRNERGVKDFIRRRFYHLADGLLLYGHYARELGVRRGFDPRTMYVVYNSLDYVAQRAARAAVRPAAARAEATGFFAHPERPLLICVSRLVAKRGLDLMLAALVQLQESGCPMNLLLVGDGPQRQGLAEFAATHALDVHFYGACYEEARLAELVMAADATVAPGMVGLTAMQSLAYGTPVVTHDDWDRQAPEWEAIEPGVSGYFFRFGDARDLARAVVECVQQLPWGAAARAECDAPIRERYNPANQAAVIHRAVAGLPAEDQRGLRVVAEGACS